LALALSATGFRQWLLASLVGMAALCTLLTQSRSAIVGMAIGAALVAGLARVGWRTVLSAGLALAVFGYLVSTRLQSQEDLLLRFDRLGVAGEFRPETGLGRLRIARASMQVLANNPLGTGFGSDIASVGRQVGISGLSSHNALLRLGVEMGIPGLLVGLWLVFRQFRSLWEVARQGATPAWRMLGAACVGAAACCWFHNMFHDVLHSGYVWLFFATASAVCLQGIRSPAPGYVQMTARSMARA
jgi:O-antigen ligase